MQALDTEIRMPLCEPCSTSEFEQQRQHDCKLALDVALTRAGITPRRRDWTLDTYPVDAAAALAAGRGWLNAYRNGENRNLWLSGPVGNGKSGLAWSLVRELTESSITDFFAPEAYADEAREAVEPPQAAMFVVWRDLLNDLRNAYQSEQRAWRGEGDADPCQMLERAHRVPVLALDDLGAERPTAWALDKLATLVDQRYQRKQPTIITSNYSTRELAVRLSSEAEKVVGERIVSRLLDGSVGYRFTDKSRRRAVST